MPSALVIGGAKQVFEEVKQALELFEPDAFFVTNDSIVLWPGRADYLCTLHPEKLAEWIRNRGLRGHPKAGKVCTHRKSQSTADIIDEIYRDWGGSTGLFAVRVAIAEGFDKIVGAGVPMEGRDRHIIRKEEWAQAAVYHHGWLRHQAELTPIFRSMSGWTKQVFHAPTKEWLSG